MFESNSRYANVALATITVVQSDGTLRQVRYVRRRFAPAPADLALLVEHEVAADERLDNITARYLGDPEQFWRLCDANAAMAPDDLTSRPGRFIRVPVPQF